MVEILKIKILNGSRRNSIHFLFHPQWGKEWVTGYGMGDNFWRLANSQNIKINFTFKLNYCNLP
jgi:hypothetical protein